jgi:hypothetical protein
MQVHQAEVRPQTEQAAMTSQGFATMAGWWNARVRAAMIWGVFMLLLTRRTGHRTRELMRRD